MAETERDTWIDKTDWGDGPWQHEPDRSEWRIGPFVALALRQPTSGHWCGYLGVPPGHPWHGQDYVDVAVEVHGGLTFAQASMEDDRPQRERVCHVPQPGEPADVWWLGFDCAHFMDRRPGEDVRYGRMRLSDLTREGTYRDLDYVTDQIAGMATQAWAAS